MRVSHLLRGISTAAVILSAPLFFIAVHAAKEMTFVAQATVDSLVDRAFYVLNSVGDPASGISRDQAVSSATDIAVKLRKLAEHDQNRKYILWKVGELEAQIYLEREGLLLEKEQWKQKNINDIIPSFNAALGKRRPGFKELWNIQGRMAAVDQNMGIDCENSIRKRAFALAKEVPSSFEAAIANGSIDSAQAELTYLQLNRDYLGISPAGYAAFEAKLSVKTSIEDERGFVQQSLERFRAALKNNDIAGGVRENALLRDKVRALRGRMLSYDWNKINKDFELFSSKLTRKQDSLVDIAQSRLRKNGPSAAAAFLDTMKQRGVSIDKISAVDQMVLASVVARKQRENATTASGIIVVADSANDNGANPFNDLMAQARRRAQEKNDSVLASRSELGRTTQVEEVRRARLRVAGTLQEMRDQDVSATEKATALQELVAIYTSLEQRKPREAFDRFAAVKENLRRNLSKEDFAKVNELVMKESGK